MGGHNYGLGGPGPLSLVISCGEAILWSSGLDYNFSSRDNLELNYLLVNKNGVVLCGHPISMLWG